MRGRRQKRRGIPRESRTEYRDESRPGRREDAEGAGLDSATPQAARNMINRVYPLIERVGRRAAPDPRTEVYAVEAYREGTCLVLTGYVSAPGAIETLLRRLRRTAGIDMVRDEIVRLPSWRENRRMNAVITAAAAPMLAGPLISESPLSQVPMGHGVMILRQHGRWFQCRASDGNLGWIHRGYLRPTEEDWVKGWEAGAVAPLHLSLGTEIIGAGGELLYRLPWGAIFGRKDGQAILPDGSTGAVIGETVALVELRDRYPRTGVAVVETARRWRGAPYVWGGVTPWGADCSGLVQATFRIHGVELPRDSDQQAAIGEEIDPGERFEHFLPGDLLFFAERSDRISHVAISTGGGGIIHSALGIGGVGENNLLEERPYERELRSYFVAARRLKGLGL
jgi:gamma-D-glutamyl-L-lysine dipeptidyl-peptidase